jgi:FdhD protein
MGHAVAQQVGMSLLARCSGKHFLLLAGHERLVFEPDLLDHLNAPYHSPRPA